MENPVLKPAKDALDRLSADPEARLRAEQREMALLSHDLDLTKVRREGRTQGIEEGRTQGIEVGRQEGRTQGIEVGRQEGRTQGKAEILHGLLTLRFGKPPARFAQRLASASDAELVFWSERLLSAETLEGVFE